MLTITVNGWPGGWRQELTSGQNDVRLSKLGRTSLEVSVLGFGAATLGDEYGAIDAGVGQRAVDAAIDHGINFFDVSPYYGRMLAEERLGSYLQGKRDRVVLATKVGRYDREPPDGFDFSAGRVLSSIEQSLRRLRTDVIDLYLAHDIEFGSLPVILEETLPAMRRLQEEGKVRFIGVTGYPLELLRDIAIEAEIDVVLSYCHYNLLNTRLDRELVPTAREQGVGLVNASPLHMGALTSGGPPPWHPAPASVLSAAREAAAWCAARGHEIADIALRFALSNAAVASTLVGMRTEAEVEANLGGAEAPPEDDVLSAVQELLRDVQDVEWPSGADEQTFQPSVSS